MSEMVERVGLAIARHIHKDADYGLDGETAFEYRRDDFLGMARAAIEAMREPTDEMVDVGHANIAPWWSPAMRNAKDYANTHKAALSAFRGMIDEALSQSPSSLPPEDR